MLCAAFGRSQELSVCGFIVLCNQYCDRWLACVVVRVSVCRRPIQRAQLSGGARDVCATVEATANNSHRRCWQRGQEEDHEWPYRTVDQVAHIHIIHNT